MVFKQYPSTLIISKSEFQSVQLNLTVHYFTTRHTAALFQFRHSIREILPVDCLRHGFSERRGKNPSVLEKNRCISNLDEAVEKQKAVCLLWWTAILHGVSMMFHFFGITCHVLWTEHIDCLTMATCLLALLRTLFHDSGTWKVIMSFDDLAGTLMVFPLSSRSIKSWILNPKMTY